MSVPHTTTLASKDPSTPIRVKVDLGRLHSFVRDAQELEGNMVTGPF